VNIGQLASAPSTRATSTIGPTKITAHKASTCHAPLPLKRTGSTE
jgi:hypothetical protein